MKAKWIGFNTVKNKSIPDWGENFSYKPDTVNYIWRFRKKFNLEDAPEQLSLRLTADSFYVLFLNGKNLGSGPLRGTKTLSYYDEYEVASVLKEGENILEVLLSSPIKRNFICDSYAPALYLEMGDLLCSDEEWLMQQAPDFKQDVPDYTFQMGFMEHRDFRQIEEIDQLPWQKVQLIEIPEILQKQIVKRDIGELKREYFYPNSIVSAERVPSGDAENIYELPKYLNNESRIALQSSEQMKLLEVDKSAEFDLSEGGISLILDFDQIISGKYHFEVKGKSGIIVDVICAEMLWNDRLCAWHEGSPNYHFTDRFILKEGWNQITTMLSERGFNLLQIVLRGSGKVYVKNIKGETIRYPWRRRAAFTCSDPLLNRIQEVSVNTLEACSSDVFMDCPWRERAFWVNDLLVLNHGSLAAFGAGKLHKRAFKLLFSHKDSQGLLPAVCPRTEGDGSVFPATNLFMMLILKEYLFASGDLETVRRYLPEMEKVFSVLSASRNEKGLLIAPQGCWHFYDWSFQHNGYTFTQSPESMLNSLYIRALKTFMELEKIVKSGSTKCQEYEQEILRSKELLFNEFVIDERLYDNCLKIAENKPTKISSQLSHALALLSGETPAELQESFIAALNDMDILLPDLYMHYFIFEAMHKFSQNEAALERIRKFWGKCILTGHSTLYEFCLYQFGHSVNHAASLCHAFGSSPIIFFQKVILGVEALQPAFKEFLFLPDLLDLEFARGRVPTPQGDIFIELQKEKDKIKVQIDIPFGCKAVLKNGKKLDYGKHNLLIPDK